MKKVVKKSVGLILACTMILAPTFSAYASEQANDAATLSVAPRAVTYNIRSKTISYNGHLLVGRGDAVDSSQIGKMGYVRVLEERRMYIHAGVPVTLGFSFNESHYVRVYFKDKTDGHTRILFTGSVKDFNNTYTFDRDMDGHFYIDNWTAGAITTNSLFVSY